MPALQLPATLANNPRASTAHDVDWPAIDRAFDELEQLASVIADASKFYDDVLATTTNLLVAIGATAWVKQGETLAIVAEVGTATTDSLSEGDYHQHQQTIAKIIGDGQPQTLELTSCITRLQPIKVDDAVAAVVTINFAHVPEHASTFIEQVLQSISEIAADFHRRDKLRNLAEDAEQWSAQRRFTSAIHLDLDLRATSFAVVNETRTLVDCDRVSLLLRRGTRLRVEAVSGTDDFNARASCIRNLESLATLTANTGEDFDSLGPQDTPPQVAQSLDGYIDASHARRIAIVRLTRSENQDDLEIEPSDLGVLVLEWFEKTDSALLETHKPLLREQTTIALDNALRFSSVPLANWWPWQSARRPPTRRFWLILATVTLVIVAAMCFIPAEFTVTVPGELQPVTRNHVFATATGIVDELRCEHGDRVKKGQPLIVIDSPEIDLKLQDLAGEMQTVKKRLSGLRASRVDHHERRTSSTSHRIVAERRALEQQLESLRQQYKLLQRRRQSLTIRSPIDGEVITWDVARQLQARPVQMGETLLTVADTEGSWQLELQIADSLSGYVSQELRASQTTNVSFVLDADPSSQYSGVLRSVASAARVDADGARSVCGNVDLSSTSLGNPRPHAAVRAKISCGRRALGFVWFHELIDSVRTRIWF